MSSRSAGSQMLGTRHSHDSLETLESVSRLAPESGEATDVEISTSSDESLLRPPTLINQSRFEDESDQGSGVDQNEKLPSKEPRASRKLSHTRHFLAWWIEGLWCLLSVGIIFAMVILLHRYDQQPRPRWPAELTLNTVVAVLATMCRAITVIPISEGIFQLKWSWFVRSKRPLRDLYAFDQASRGPWGSLQLLITTRGR